ncbi:MAG TPA: hypothetical protein VHL80_10355 [Polyangia bacterium]|nr:hypothetical protein [Polyangia bacterium]
MTLFARHADLGAHFAGRSSTRADRRLFRHLKTCAACREEYRTYAMLEALDADGAERARVRMGRGLFEPVPARRAFVSAGLVAACACLALVVSFGRTRPSEFAVRGGVHDGDAPLPSLAIYRVPREADNAAVPAVEETQRAGGVVHAGESLAFTYVNPPAVGATHAMIFGRDAAGRVYWFWPAWTDGSQDPESVPISAGGAPVELTEAVRHSLQPGPLTIVGLFTPKPLHVREVEAAVANGLDGLQAFPGHVWTETVEVAP